MIASQSPFLIFATAAVLTVAAADAFATLHSPPSSTTTAALQARSASAWTAPRVHSAALVKTISPWLVRARGGASNLRAAAATAPATDVEEFLGENAGVLSQEEVLMAQTLLDLGQGHLMEDWPPAGEDDDKKRSLIAQAKQCDAQYPGGLTAYITKARKLLADSANGVNPFDGYKPEMADGEALVYNTAAFEEMEQAGLSVIGKTGFVLVAGGLGERLGFNGIKLSLPVEVTTRTTYLSLYIQFILEQQRRARAAGSGDNTKLHLVIMTSEDTDAATKTLLEDNDYYGMELDQISIIMQDKVPALGDTSAKLVTKSGNKFELETKPHGHGDVHQLMHKSGIARKLKDQGFKYLLFFQDTNALVLNSVLPTLGVSVTKGFQMNSICVPRKAQEAAGAIVALTHTDGSSLIINVEYNQLDPLLRATISPGGDVNDPNTGFSPFPGNTNNIVFELESYVKTVSGEDEGVVVEFVNPKYKDKTRTTFTKPTRLECMMQDFPKLMAKELSEEERHIGFTSLDKWLSFSPAKNSLAAGAASAASGVPPNTASSAEAEYYAQNVRRIAEVTGAQFGKPVEYEFEGVPFEMGPRVVFSPSFAVTTADIREKISSNVKVSSTSTLIIDGAGVKVESLELDGTLIIQACAGATVTVRDLIVNNDGWTPVPLPQGDAAAAGGADTSDSVEEVDRVRGFVLDRREAAIVEILKPGAYILGPEGKVTPDESVDQKDS